MKKPQIIEYLTVKKMGDMDRGALEAAFREALRVEQYAAGHYLLTHEHPTSTTFRGPPQAAYY